MGVAWAWWAGAWSQEDAAWVREASWKGRGWLLCCGVPAGLWTYRSPLLRQSAHHHHHHHHQEEDKLLLPMPPLRATARHRLLKPKPSTQPTPHFLPFTSPPPPHTAMADPPPSHGGPQHGSNNNGNNKKHVSRAVLAAYRQTIESVVPAFATLMQLEAPAVKGKQASPPSHPPTHHTHPTHLPTTPNPHPNPPNPQPLYLTRRAIGG